ncbi:MAG: hypothetical protein CK538_01795 [Opitutia bacterium]|nr:MAG: hypothetical protein CK538_01795 [Opitutae bacterium]
MLFMSAPRPPLFFLPLFAALLLGTVTRSGAQLAQSSPFMPVQAAGTTAVTEGAPLELRGVMDTGSGILFGIFDPAKKVSVWSKLNEKDHDFLVKSYDATNETVTVQHGGRTLNLAMRASKVASSGQATAPPPMSAPTGMPTAVTQSVVLNPTPADEQRRLEAVAAEVRRRRALREQASIQAAQGQTPVVEAPAPAAQVQRGQRAPTQGQNQNQNQNQNRPKQRN